VLDGLGQRAHAGQEHGRRELDPAAAVGQGYFTKFFIIQNAWLK
jgi:hypothetical protein